MKTNKNTPYYLISGCLFIVLKIAFKYSTTADLHFLIKPINLIVEFLLGYKSVVLENGACFYERLNVVIGKSCSGANFLLLCFMMLVFQTLNHCHTRKQKVFAIPLSLLGAYITTIFTNSSRIFTSIILQNMNIDVLRANPEITHQSIGIITNITCLIILYLLIEKITTKYLNYAQSA